MADVLSALSLVTLVAGIITNRSCMAWRARLVLAAGMYVSSAIYAVVAGMLAVA